MSSKAATHSFSRSRQLVPNTGLNGVPEQYTDTVHLYRESDGLRLGTAKDALVQFGIDPQQAQMRVFKDHRRAVSFLRVLADRDWAVMNGADSQAPDFLERVKGYAAEITDADDHPRIVSPNQARAVPSLM